MFVLLAHLSKGHKSL